MKRNYNDNLIPIRSIHRNIYDSEFKKIGSELEKLYEKISELESANAPKGKIKNLKNKYEILSKKSDEWKFDNRRSMYENKREIIAKKIPKLAFYYNENHTIKKELSKDEAIIYEVLISTAANENTIVYKWCSANELETEIEIVELYEYIKNEILHKCKKNNKYNESHPFIFLWLDELSYTLDYPISKQIIDVKNKLLELQEEAIGIRNQINYGSILLSDGYQQRYVGFQEGKAPSALPKNEIPENYKSFAHEYQFFSGLYTFMWRFLDPNIELNEEEPPLKVNLPPLVPVRTAKELKEIIYLKECETFKNHIDQTRYDLKKVSDKCKKKELERKLVVFLKGERRSRNKDSRMRTYNRMFQKFIDIFPVGASFLLVNNLPNICDEKEKKNRSKQKSDIKYDYEQQAVYFSIIRRASLPGSIVNLWFNNRIDKYGLEAVIVLYETIYSDIYTFLQVNRPGFFPSVDQWLQILDVELDYSVAKLIDAILFNLYVLRTNTFKQRYESAFDSETKQLSKEEIFLKDFENLIKRYIEETRIKCNDYLTSILKAGNICYDLINDDNDDSECENIQKGKSPEYVQAIRNVQCYLNNNNASSEVLNNLNISKEQANMYIEALLKLTT